MRRTSTSSQAGFTLVEIAVVAPIVIIAITGILALLINLMGNNLAARAEVAIVHDVNATLTTIEDDVKIASRFLTTIDGDFSDPYGPNNAGATWNYNGGGEDSRTLIARTYATTLSPRDSRKQPVYLNENGCTPDTILTNPALTTNTIYFLHENNLYRRVLTRSTSNACAEQFQRQSCPPDIASPNAICQANDTLLLRDVSAFKIAYYSTSSSTTPLNVYGSSDPNVLAPAATVEITIEIDRRLSGQPFELTRSLRATKLN